MTFVSGDRVRGFGEAVCHGEDGVALEEGPEVVVVHVPGKV